MPAWVVKIWRETEHKKREERAKEKNIMLATAFTKKWGKYYFMCIR